MTLLGDTKLEGTANFKSCRGSAGSPCLTAETGGELHRHAGGVLLQNFVDHGGTLHKIYVVGQRVVEDLRTSLPDFQNWGQLEAQWGEPLGRISAYRRPSREEGHAGPSPLGPNLDVGMCTAIARALQAHLQLSLFNFDLIKAVLSLGELSP